ncbi:uncharacterized protein LOC119573934 [Penaeus monodon]|uniref:uncharacterized protein LOC119573934 n=1 Tax=Penaeus monodon TaxID=6687 RepID=UPI0018A70DCF|nr:uncharacterized protein LOC119573934 [Penaeus monodon]
MEYRRAKKSVALAKAESCRDVNEKLETSEGEKKIYRIAKDRNKATKDIHHVKQMKNASGVALTDEKKIQERQKEYFGGLLHEENPQEHHGHGTSYPGLTEVEVGTVLKRMKNNKATGPDVVPMEE